MPEWLPWLVGALLGSGGIVSFGYKLHQDAVSAERGRADDWRAVAKAAQARADVRDEQMAILLGSRDEVATKANGRRRRRGAGPAGSTARGGKTGNGRDPQAGQGTRRATR